MANTKAALPDYQTLTLPNGLRIVYRHIDSPVCYCGFMIDCGTRDELTPESFGMAHFIEHILFKGTRKRDSWHINNRMESVGGELNAFTTKEETTFYSVFLNHDYERAIELLCDLICHATAPERELIKEQEVVVDEIMSYRDTPSELIYDEFENRLFANHPLGHNILGSEETVRSFHSEQCLRFIADHYTSDRAVFFFQGKVGFDKVVRMVERHYELGESFREQGAGFKVQVSGFKVQVSGSRFQGSGSRGATRSDDMPEVITISEGHHQSHVLLGAETYPIGHPNAATVALINNILGGPGMNSRLNLALRERRGLVYNVESNVTSYTDTGYMGIYFGCDHDDVKRCLRLCHQEIERLAHAPLSPTQLAAAKRQLKGQLGVSSANMENNAILLAKNLLRLGRVDSLEQTCSRIDAITPELISTVMNQLFNKELLKTVIIE